VSTDYYVYCLDCKERSEFEAHPMQLRDLITHADSLAKAAEIQKVIDLDCLYLGRSFYPSWFAQHQGHRLTLIDEYGRVDGQCQKYASCSHCGKRDQCALRDGHEPPCKIKVDARQ
jgi:hypothetical protein